MLSGPFFWSDVACLTVTCSAFDCFVNPAVAGSGVQLLAGLGTRATGYLHVLSSCLSRCLAVPSDDPII